MINILIALSNYLGDNFGLTIIVLTVAVRLVLYPLTIKQLKSTKAMQTLQPKLMELQKKYGKDREKLAQEQMRLYKEAGMNPTGCMLPMLIQMPIWIALYQSIILTLAISPEGLLNISRYLYPSWEMLYPLLPLNNAFLGLDLSQGNFVMAILVGASMWIQQKMVTPKAADPRAAQQSQMMLWMMPLMFAFFSLSFPAGLSLYWVISNVISIVIQYYVTGWGGLAEMFSREGDVKKDKGVRKIQASSASPRKNDPIDKADIVIKANESDTFQSGGISGLKSKLFGKKDDKYTGK